MSSNFSVPLKAIWSDYRNTLAMNVLPGEHTVETTVGKLGKSMYKHVSREFSLQSLELGTIDMPARYYPGKLQPIIICCKGRLTDALLSKTLIPQLCSATVATVVSQSYSLLTLRRRI